MGKIQAIENPLTVGIRHVRDQLSDLEFGPATFLPSILTAPVLLIVIAILLALWPYGLVAIVEDLVRQLMGSTRDKMGEVGFIEKMPFALTLGIYLILWLPFALLCLPMALVGAIGHAVSRQ